MWAQSMLKMKKLRDLKEELAKSNHGDTFRHGDIVDKILNELLDAEIKRNHVHGS